MEKRKHIVLLAAMLLVIGAPSLLIAGGGQPLATDESFKVGEQNCQLNVGFSQLNDYIRYFSATPAFSEEKGVICNCSEGCEPCSSESASLVIANRASDAPDWCDTGAVQVGYIDDTYVCEKKDCKPSQKGTYDCTEAAVPYTDKAGNYHPNGKCEWRNSLHRRTAERLGNNTQICVNDRSGTRICLGTP